MKKILLLFIAFNISLVTYAQDANQLIQKIKSKLELVNDYTASGRMKTNVIFLKVPVATVKVYFKKPNRLKIKNEKGISFIPKGAITINMNNILSGSNFTAIDGGITQIDKTALRMVKVLPLDETGDVVLSTFYIDEAKLVVRKAKITTRDNGTYELDMTYGKYISYALPDKIVFTFNTKDYKMPKGVTFDFDDGDAQKKAEEKMKNRKGRVEIDYTSYMINKGVPDSVF